MAERSWPWSTAAGLGDGAAELNEALSREFLSLYFGVQDPTVEGVSVGVGGELEVSGVATPLSVQPGSGICYGLYINDAVKTLVVATPGVNTTGGRVVLQTNWAGTGGAGLEARTRLAVKMSADGTPTPPALTQAFGTTWEISLATFTVTTGGVIAVTDDRTFRRSTMLVGPEALEDDAVEAAALATDSVTADAIIADAVGDVELRNSAGVSVIGRAANSTGNPADIVAGANDRVLGRTGDALSFLQLTIGMFVDGVITLAKLANLAGVSLLGRAANSTGVMAAITAAANDTLLRRTGDALNFGALTIGMIADALITHAKIANLTGLSVFGRAANSAGVMAAITAANDNEVLQRQGATLAWDTLDNSNIDDRTRAIFISPNEFVRSAGTGTIAALAGSTQPWAVMQLLNAETGTWAVMFQVPLDMVTGNLDVRVFAAASAAGNARLRFRGLARVNGENLSAALGLDSTVTAGLTGGASFPIDEFIAGNIPAVAGDVVGFTIDRIGADAADTLAVTLNVLGVSIRYTADM